MLFFRWDTGYNLEGKERLGHLSLQECFGEHFQLPVLHNGYDILRGTTVESVLRDLPPQELALFGRTTSENSNQMYLPRLQVRLYLTPAKFTSRRIRFLRVEYGGNKIYLHNDEVFQ